MPNTARASPSGNGSLRRFLLTKCSAGTGMRSARPGSASPLVGIDSGFFENIDYLHLTVAEARLTAEHAEFAENSLDSRLRDLCVLGGYAFVRSLKPAPSTSRLRELEHREH